MKTILNMKKIAFLLCSDTVGGHEFQAIEFFKSAANYFDVTLFLNIPMHEKLIENGSFKTKFCKEPFFHNGNFLMQFLFSVKKRKMIRKMVNGYDDVVICSGTAEAGICLGYALFGKRIYLYVPMFVDRKVLWGKIGFFYNLLLPFFILPYKAVITINRIQAYFFSPFKKTYILPNKITKRIDIHLDKGFKKLYFIGRLEKSKNVLELIKWLDHPQNPYSKFEIIGNGSQMPLILKAQRNTKYITIVVKGWLSKEEQESELSSDDVLVTNSLYEGEPLIIREANDRGSVVIARNIIGHRACTYKDNRFKSQNELLRLLNLAYKDKLRTYKNQSINEIERRREEIIEYLFV